MTEIVNCRACAAANPPENVFCGQCGERLDARALTAADVRHEVEQHLDRLLTDRDVVEYKIAEAAAERVMGWAKLMAFFAGAIVTVLITALGWLSFDLKSRLKEQAAKLALSDAALGQMSKRLKDAQPQLTDIQQRGAKLRQEYAALENDIGPLRATRRDVDLALQASRSAQAAVKTLSMSIASSGAFHNCPPIGDSGDQFLNQLKNRDVAPEGYTDMSVDAMIANRPAAVEMMGRRKRDAWTDDALAKVAATEKKGVRISGYLLLAKREGPESCNCHSDTDRDFHLWLATDATATKDRAMIVEISPRELPNHPKWTQARLEQLVSAHTPVRVSGWLLWDEDHPEQVGRTRGTLWEVHPIHLIEVQTSVGWKTLDEIQ